MKVCKILTVLTGGLFILSSCQKELSDPGGTTSVSSNLLSRLTIKGTLIPQQAEIAEVKYDNLNRTTRIYEVISDTSSGTLQTDTVIDLRFFYNASELTPYKYQY